MAKIQIFDSENLQAICDVLGDTSSGLTGSEIGKLLVNCNIEDVTPGITKRDRLFNALSYKQNIDRCGNNVIAFIMKSMNPVRYVRNQEIYEERINDLNEALSFSGFEIGNDGKIHKRDVAKTLNEANLKAKKLRQNLISRKVHHDVLKFCKAELLHDNYFHAVFEATKSVADKIREKSGLSSDGSKLVDDAFGMGKSGYPMLAFNSLRTDTEKSEHKGIMNLIKGLFGTFRNVTAHAPKIKWVIEEQDALDILSLTSLIHRRLDNSVKTK